MSVPQIYPVRPVITNNIDFAKSYNAHPISALMISACISSHEAEQLVQQGAKFDSVHIIGDVGTDIADQVARSNSDTHVHRISSIDGDELNVDTIHGMIRAEITDAGMG